MSYYNVGAKYEIIGRVTKGTSVIAYMLRDKVTKAEEPMEKGIVEQLALNRQIYNCSGQVYNNLVCMKGINCKLSQLPKYTIDGEKIIDESEQDSLIPKFKLVGKVQTGRTVVAYMAISDKTPDLMMRIPKDIVIGLARDGRVINAKAQKNAGTLMLRGTTGVNLSQLKNYAEE